MDKNLFSQDVRHWLALLNAPGIGLTHFKALLTAFPEPKALFANNRLTLPDHIRLSAKTLKYLNKPDWQRIDNDLRWAQEKHCYIFTCDDPRYPPLLKEIPDPPPLLFVRGNPEILSHPQLAIVGSRNPSAGGRQMAQDFAQQLSATGLTITSGLALGVDAASHLGALVCGGKTVAVTGTGLDRIYPARNHKLGQQIIEEGAVVSEFPPGTPPLASNFPRRNRIISGLSLGTLVVEAAMQSGSLITARLAAEQGREVFALPGSIHNPLAKGCHALIRQGAKLCENVTHILEELGPLASIALAPAIEKSLPRQSPDADSNQLMENMGYEPTGINTLVERCGLTPETISAMLLLLELQGRVISTGGLYCRTD